MDTVIIGKVENVERCLARIKEHYFDASTFSGSIDQQDIVVLNLQRACESVIDIAAHLVRIKKLGVAKTNAMLFDVLEEHKLIDKGMAEDLTSMVGFRNLAIHEYVKVNLDVVVAIVEKHLDEFKQFCQIALNIASN